MSSSADNTLGKLRDVVAQRREVEERILPSGRRSLHRALDLITRHDFQEMEDSYFSVPFSYNCCWSYLQEDDFGEVPVQAPQSMCFSEAGVCSCAGSRSSGAPAALPAWPVLSQPQKYLQ